MPKLISTSLIVETGLATQKSLFTDLGITKKEFANILGYTGSTYSCAYEMAAGTRAIPLRRVPDLMDYFCKQNKQGLCNPWTCAILCAHGYRVNTEWYAKALPTPKQFLKLYDKRRLFDLGATSRIIRYMPAATPNSLDMLFGAIMKYHTQCALFGSELINYFESLSNADYKASKIHTIFMRNDGWLV